MYNFDNLQLPKNFLFKMREFVTEDNKFVFLEKILSFLIKAKNEF